MKNLVGELQLKIKIISHKSRSEMSGFFMLKTHVMKLNTENTNCFTYTTDELLIELLGGVRIEGLDRMRVNSGNFLG
jgi:hypothetical protein